MKQRFFRCAHCGNIIAFVKDTGVPVMCCGQKMTEILPGQIAASEEKHIPVYKIENNKVYVVVGDIVHPSEEGHYIEWISIQTKQGNQRKCLKPGDKPAVCFSICNGDTVEAVYAYCNLHGLWSAEAEYDADKVCDLQPLDTTTNENYVICKCNKVKYFDIIDAVQNSKDISSLLGTFDRVKDTTHCSTGCGGCYNKVIAVISEVMSGSLS